jgi:hypothetical protein
LPHQAKSQAVVILTLPKLAMLYRAAAYRTWHNLKLKLPQGQRWQLRPCILNDKPQMRMILGVTSLTDCKQIAEIMIAALYPGFQVVDDEEPQTCFRLAVILSTFVWMLANEVITHEGAHPGFPPGFTSAL